MAVVPLRDGKALNVFCLGRGEPVILLHGFGFHGLQWLPNILPLTHRYRFYLPDLRGFGQSHLTAFSQHCVFSTYAQDLADVIDHFKLNDVILGGVSTGAFTCLVYNQLYGFGKVKKYLHIEHGSNSKSCNLRQGIFKERQAELFSHFDHIQSLAAQYDGDMGYWELPVPVRIAMRDTVMRVYRLAFNRTLSRALVSVAAQKFERVLTRFMMPTERWRVYLTVMAAFQKGFETEPGLASINIPTTFMIGRHSRYFSYEEQIQMAEQVPASNVAVFERSGHVPMADEPLAFQRAFTRFLSA